MTNNKSVFARFTPISFTWAGLSGDWNVATNWSPSLVPGSNDNVIINNSVVTLNSPADCNDVTLGAGSPTLTGSGNLTVRGDLSFLSGTLSGSGNLTVLGNGSWTAGDMTGSGRTIISPGATLNISNSGQIVLATRTLENGGTVLWTGAGNLPLLGGAVITNRAGALFHVQGSGGFAFNGNENGRLDNAGTFRKSTQAGATTTGAINVNNYGIVDIQNGTLSLGGGGTHSGSFNVSAGAALILSGGTHTGEAGSSITGSGQFTVSGGTANLGGLVNITGSNTFTAGTANLTGNYIRTNNTITISGGTANFSGTGLVSPTSVTLSSGTLSGTSVVTVNNTMNWSAGDMTGSGRTIISPGATLNISNSGQIVLTTRTLENGGTVLWTGAGNLPLLSGAVITNRAGALFHVQASGSFSFNGNENGRIDNAGTFRKSNNAGTTTSGAVVFNNYSIVDIQTGTLNLGGGGTHSGSFTTPAGTALALGGTHNAGAASSITGAGQLAISGGTANFAGLVNVTGSNIVSGGTANFTGDTFCTNNTVAISVGTANFSGSGLVSPSVVRLTSGTLSGSGIVTVLSAMTWTDGSMTGSGRTVIAPGATLTVSNPGLVNISTRTLENGGTVLWTGAGNLPLLGGAVITNRAGALFHVQGSGGFAFNGNENGRIDNAGTFRKSSNSGTATTGKIAFNNFGTVDLRSGILAASVGYVSSPNAVLNCSLGGTTAGTGYGQLQVAGTVTLSGGLSVDFLPGFSPATNDTFTVLTAGTRSSAFTSFSYPSNRVTMLLSNSTTSVILRITDVLPIPQPILLTPQLVGSNALLTWTATSNVTYRLESNPDVASTNWTALTGDVTTLSNTASKLDSRAPSNRFYRVRVLP